MALARIITRSHQYAQQLALDLLARGYAVEVISPDAIPKGPADLELRVEPSGADLQGQVTEVREQGKAAKSIEYLQRLKPMMADLLRKGPADIAPKPSSERSAEFNFNGEAECSSDAELPSGEYRSESQARPMAPAQESSHDPDFAESVRRIEPTVSQKPSAAASSIFSITGEPISW